jgi:ABC-type phosphate transport system substrate-binding protein
MDFSTKRVRPRHALLAAGAAAIAFLALPGPALAGPPVPSQACVNAPNGDPTDGEISGTGATFANRAQNALITGYTQDVCGTPNMVHYNDAALQPGVQTGSGAGQNATSWRAQMFGGTDIPYDINGLNNLNGPCGTGFAKPTSSTPLMAPMPDPCTDPEAPVMSFPIAGSSVALAINLQSARDCGGSAIGTLRFNNLQVSRILGGDISHWNNAALRTGGQNAGLANCNVPIVRVVRQDRSGTTQIVKNYLARADSTRAGGTPAATCDTARRWGVQPGSTTQPDDLNLDPQNRDWPGAPADPPAGVLVNVAATANCTAVHRSASNGAPALLTTLGTTAGGVGYADLADVVAAPALIRPELRNAPNTAFVSAQAGQDANCSFTGLTLPGGGDSALAVGLDPSDSWAVDQPNGHMDPTLTGTAYPMCGLTFVFVYTGLSDTTAAPDAISRMTNNQRRTLYSYYTYVLSPLGQERLTNINYSPLPPSWLSSLRRGFQENF